MLCCRLSTEFRNSASSLRTSGVVSQLFRSTYRVFVLDIKPTLNAPLVVVRSSSSSSGNAGGDPLYKIEALPFSVSPEAALAKFHKWTSEEQGLTSLLHPRSVRIGAAFCPVWSFDVNIRFVVHEGNGRRRLGWKPDVFAQAYGDQSVIHLPGLSAYAGYSYRRSLVNPLHNTSLVFLGDQTVPFGKWMLRDMMHNGHRLEVFPDPWNTTRGRALAVVRDELQSIAHESSPEREVEVQTEVVASRRVYMPTYVITYQVLGVEYQAFVSGCDSGAGVSGLSHQIWSEQVIPDSSNFLTQALSVAQRGATVLGGRGLFVLIQLLGGILSRLILRLPLIGLLAGTFVGFRKILQPLYRQYTGSAEWERQRENETFEKMDSHKDDFIDSGAAQRYFRGNRGRILRDLSGTSQHEQGKYEWYKEWEAWARQQWSQQQQEQQFQGPREDSKARPRKPKGPPDFQWDFDRNDPYSVLGVSRSATKSEVSAAYRKEMLKYHPDMQAQSTDAEKIRASERAKLINEAYRKIKLQMK